MLGYLPLVLVLLFVVGFYQDDQMLFPDTCITLLMGIRRVHLI